MSDLKILKVCLPDGTYKTEKLGSKCLTSDAKIRISDSLNIKNQNLFGFYYKDDNGVKYWLSDNKSVFCHDFINFSNDSLDLYFSFKYFFTFDDIKQDVVSKFFFYHHLKEQLYSGDLELSDSELCFSLLAMTLLLNDCNKDIEELESKIKKIIPAYLFQSHPSIAYCFKRITHFYNSYSESSCDSLMNKFLDTIVKLPYQLYHYFNAKDSNNISVSIGINKEGLVECSNLSKNPTSFTKKTSWSDISNIRCNKSRVYFDTVILNPKSSLRRSSNAISLSYDVSNTFLAKSIVNLCKESSVFFQKQHSADSRFEKKNMSNFKGSLSGKIRNKPSHSLSTLEDPYMIRSSSRNSLASTVNGSFQTNDSGSMQLEEASITSKSILEQQQHFEELNKKRENLIATIKDKTELVIESCKNECTLTGVMPEDYNKLNIKNPFKLTQNILKFKFLEKNSNQFEEKKRNILMEIETLNNMLPHLKKTEKKEKEKQIICLRDNLRVLERDHAYSMDKKRSSSLVNIHRLDDNNETDNGDVKKGRTNNFQYAFSTLSGRSRKIGSSGKLGGLLNLHNFNGMKTAPDLETAASNEDEIEGVENDNCDNNNEEEEDESVFRNLNYDFTSNSGNATAPISRRNPNPINQSDSSQDVSLSELESAIDDLHPGITKTPSHSLSNKLRDFKESSITSSSTLTTSPLLINNNNNFILPDQNYHHIQYQQQPQHNHHNYNNHHIHRSKQLCHSTNSSSSGSGSNVTIDKLQFQRSSNLRHHIVSTKGQTSVEDSHLSVNRQDSATTLDPTSSSASSKTDSITGGSTTSDISDFISNQEDGNNRPKLCKVPEIRKMSNRRSPSNAIVCRDSREIIGSKMKKANFIIDSSLVTSRTVRQVRDNSCRLSTSLEDLPTQTSDTDTNSISNDHSQSRNLPSNAMSNTSLYYKHKRTDSNRFRNKQLLQQQQQQQLRSPLSPSSSIRTAGQQCSNSKVIFHPSKKVVAPSNITRGRQPSIIIKQAKPSATLI